MYVASEKGRALNVHFTMLTMLASTHHKNLVSNDCKASLSREHELYLRLEQLSLLGLSSMGSSEDEA